MQTTFAVRFSSRPPAHTATPRIDGRLGLRVAAMLATGALLGSAGAVRAATTDTPADTPATSADMQFARSLSRLFQSVAERSERGVVHITQIRTLTRRDFFGQVLDSREVEAGVGSGAVVDPSGIILTNNHVIEQAERLRVRFSDGREVPAEVVGRDPQTDLAVLRVRPEGNGAARAATMALHALPFADSDKLEVGEWVVAIGSPFGLDNTVTQGIVSAKGRTVTPRETGRSFEDYIQTDASINPGNSGGPLLNLEGQIVGINTAIASRSGGYDGIGFAIPANTARLVLDSIVKHGRVLRGWLGVGMENVVNNDEGTIGVRVTEVADNSPAATAGLKPGDIITRFQGQQMDQQRLRNAIASLPAGSSVNLVVDREGEGAPLTIAATLGDRGMGLGLTYVPELGLSVLAVDARIAEEVGIEGGKGVVVAEVEPTGRAARTVLRPNDIILEVDGRAVDTVQDFQAAIARRQMGRENVRLSVVRAEQRRMRDGSVGTQVQRGFVDVGEP